MLFIILFKILYYNIYILILLYCELHDLLILFFLILFYICISSEISVSYNIVV